MLHWMQNEFKTDINFKCDTLCCTMSTGDLTLYRWNHLVNAAIYCAHDA